MKSRAWFSASVALASLFGSLVASGCSDAAAPLPAIDGGVASTDGPASSAPANVTVEYKGASAVVDVAALARRDYKGSQVVALDKIWEASKTSASLAKVEFEFEADDGFRPSARDRCKTKIVGSQLPQGYVLPETRTLVWDDALGLPGCYSVKYVAKVIVTDKP